MLDPKDPNCATQLIFKQRPSVKESQRSQHSNRKDWCVKPDAIFLIFKLHYLFIEDSFQLTYDWIKSVGKNVNKLKSVTLLGFLL